MGAFGISLLGFFGFYVIPFFTASFYVFTNNPIQRKFVGGENFIDIMNNRFFLLGLKNTLLFMAVAIPISMILSLLLAIGIKEIHFFSGIFSLLFLMPLVLPSASIAQYGIEHYMIFLNGIRKILGYGLLEQMGEWESRLFMVGIYIWKYVGYNMVLFQAGLYAIPKEYYHWASLLGAGKWQKFYYITLLYLSPSFFIVFIMSFVNSFKIFREIYFVYGGYPAEGMYLLQHFMNSTLLSLNYQKLVSAVYILTLLIAVVVIVAFKMEKYIAQNLTE